MMLRRAVTRLSVHRMNIDRWAVVYLLISAFYPLLRPSVFPSPWTNALLHGSLALVFWFVPAWLRSRRFFLPRLLGEIYLPFFFPLFYAEMEFLGLIFFDFHASFDPALIKAEQLMFGLQPSLQWSRAWSWPWLHELMEAAYFSYYFLPLIFLTLVFKSPALPRDRRWDTVRNYIRDLSATMLICYTLYTLFPAWGPKFFRAGYVEVDGWFFTAIMRNIHENGAILGAAFPSSHVAASMITWWYVWTRFSRHRWWMTAIFLLLCLSTVYCRYHYVVDVLAGLILGALVLVIGSRFGGIARERLRRLAP